MITGAANRSAIGTLVERTSRYVLLVHLQGRHTTQTTCSGVPGALSPLPDGLRKSLAWGQGTDPARRCPADLQAVQDQPRQFS